MKIKDLNSFIPNFRLIGNPESEIKFPYVVFESPWALDESSIMWVKEGNEELYKSVDKGTIVVSDTSFPILSLYLKDVNFIITDNPRNVFFKILRKVYFDRNPSRIYDNASYIDKTSIIGSSSNIGFGVVIEENVVIGNNSVIGHNTVIKKDTIIGNDVSIGSNCTIGGVGFGYEKDPASGMYEFLPHPSNVIIEDSVEIGNNTCIDRGVLSPTRICFNAKIDNLVHIAHGVKVGQNSLIIANAMVAGSVTIGENVWVAPSSSIMNGKKIGNNAVIGLAAVSLKNVEEGDIIIGNPGKSLRK